MIGGRQVNSGGYRFSLTYMPDVQNDTHVQEINTDDASLYALQYIDRCEGDGTIGY